MAWRDYRGTVGDRLYWQDISIKKYNVIGFSSHWRILSSIRLSISQCYSNIINLQLACTRTEAFLLRYIYDYSYYLLLLNWWQHLDQVWSILPVLELLFLDWARWGLTSWGGATQMQAKWIKLDQGVILSRLYQASWWAWICFKQQNHAHHLVRNRPKPWTWYRLHPLGWRK